LAGYTEASGAIMFYFFTMVLNRITWISRTYAALKLVD
jgi:hypothetical protein